MTAIKIYSTSICTLGITYILRKVIWGGYVVQKIVIFSLPYTYEYQKCPWPLGSWFKKAPKHTYIIIKCALTIYMLHDFFSKKLTPETL